MPQRRCVAVSTGTPIGQPDAVFDDACDDPDYESLILGLERDDPAYPHALRALARLSLAGFDAKDPELVKRAADVGRERHAASLLEPRPQPPALPAQSIEPRQPMRKWAGWVYYMRIGNRCKIGYTTNLARRMLVVVPEEVLAVEAGTRELEARRHDEFAQLRTHAEWFMLDDPLTGHVATVASGMDAAAQEIVRATVKPRQSYRARLQRPA